MPIISVIVPVYKVEPYLRRCVDSILQQSFTDFELILVDDGSPDNCPAICDQYAVQDKRVHVIHQKNGGLSAARNTGVDWTFEHSDSEWITFVDSDDWVHENYLKWMYETVHLLDVEIGVCFFKRVEEDDRILKITSILPEKILTENIYENQAEVATFIVAWGKLYSKNLWQGIRFPVGKLHEDVFTTYKLLFQKQYIGLVKSDLYYYYQNSAGIMKSAWSPRRLDEIEGLKEQIHFFEERKLQKVLVYKVRCYLWLLYETLRKVKELSPQYDKYIVVLQKQLRRDIKKYKKIIPITVEEYGYIYDMAYPFWMRQYWRLQKALRLLHLREK